MADAPETTPIQNAYAQRFANDLVNNHKEQEEVTGQIAALQARLEQLCADAAWLTQAQDSLPTVLALSAAVAEPDPGATEAPSATPAEQREASALAEAATRTPHTVPQPRHDQSEKAAQAKQPTKKTAAKKKTTTKKTADEPVPARQALAKKAAAKKTAAKKSAPEDTSAETPAKQTTIGEKSGPPLWELVQGILLKTPGQPCMAREVTDQLLQAHPTRATSIQMVRNSLETLVKKNLAEKSRQQGSAMYTAYVDAGTPPAPARDEPAGSEGKQAPEVEAENTAVKV
ncbi:hypothetical protein [Streptomyces lasalocidi]|uniref:Uncharacterized protein n=1 Tax=Streptomyces lasalocidi TaxID=324833 RepID=A0A4U5W455_STRLS|nr:hypothetical protein [Streptomyces lasalocidi]TKS96213.1 hypothetical protein E4U91_36415 [Streptomyces lasalocidi]